MRRVFPSALAAALVFTIGCGGGSDTAQMAEGSGSSVKAEKTAERDSVPLTITMPDSAPGVSSVKKVEFPGVNQGHWYDRQGQEIQYVVGYLRPDTTDDRYRFTVNYTHSNSPNDLPDAATSNGSQKFSFAPESLCQEGTTEGKINRIACSVVGKGGERLVCAATYDNMGNPPDTCTGTQACVRCKDGSRACGSNPQCSAN